jgi:hypothetical protein
MTAKKVRRMKKRKVRSYGVTLEEVLVPDLLFGGGIWKQRRAMTADIKSADLATYLHLVINENEDDVHAYYPERRERIVKI